MARRTVDLRSPLQEAGQMREMNRTKRIGIFGLAVAAALVLAAGSRADADSATHYYLALGDSLAVSAQPNGDFTHGYAEQLHSMLASDDPKLELKKLGCGGESSVSMRFGSQLPSVVLSCGSPHFYKNVLFAKGTQLAEAESFLEAHKGKVALITIDIGANDLQRLDAKGEVALCLFEPAGCASQQARLVENLAAIIDALRAAAPDVPIVGMTYYNVFAPIWFEDEPTALAVDARVASLNAALVSTYEAHGVPVADVAGAFENGVFPSSAGNVCMWTWYCSVGDIHLNTDGYGVVAKEFLAAIP
jgi:lysophospholipase L1-like esterase